MIDTILALNVLPPIDPKDIKVGPLQKIFENPEELLQTLVSDFILPILAGLAVLYLVWAGYQYFTSAGDPARVEKAHANLTYSIIGVILTVLAYGLVAGLADLIKQAVKGL